MSTQQIIESWENGVEPYKIKVRNPDATRPNKAKRTDFPSVLQSEENKRMRTQIGSQLRETLDSSGYELVARPEKRVVVLRDTDGHREIWYANDHHSGYTIQIGRWGYEYGRDCKEWEYA